MLLRFRAYTDLNRSASLASGVANRTGLFRLNTSMLKGMINRIKVIKRMAYGYRDTEYFFLKIKAAFPGKVQ